MLEAPETKKTVVVEEKVAIHDQDPKFTWFFLVVLLTLLIFAFLWSAARDSQTDIVIIDDSPNVLVDDRITVTTTDNYIDPPSRPGSANFYSDPRQNYVIENEAAFVTAVYSDRLFAISADEGSPQIFAFLDGDLDFGSAETRVDVNVGDNVVIDGVITFDYDDIRFVDNEVGVVGTRALILVDGIKFAEVPR